MALIEATNQQLFDFITMNEGPIEWIYFDNKGYLTVGIGHLVGGVRDAGRQDQLNDLTNISQHEGFFVGDVAATLDQISDRLDALLGQPESDRKNHPAGYWRTRPDGSPQVEMTQAGMVALKRRDCRARINALHTGSWPGASLAGLPIPVQIVIVDIAFNAGVAALRSQSKFQTFRTAIDAFDFSEAARIVDNNEIGISTSRRNDRRAELLRSEVTPTSDTPPQDPKGKGSGKADTAATTHVVQPGESLWRIAQRYYGNGQMWTRIYEANIQTIGKNPNLVRPGQALIIPRL